ncbi:MAG: hypothetical protein HKN92_11325 [Chitinophagales bacterium]|nr:hypothetical protein [Chitinophagales bacterium]
MKLNYLKSLILVAICTMISGIVVAQVCAPNPPVCVPSNGYAFTWELDTDFGLRFNTGTSSYEFTGGAGGLSTMVQVSAANGDLSIPGGGALQVAGNKYAFQYTADNDFGLFFNATGEQYEFRNQDATPVVAMDAIKGNTAIGTSSNSDAYKLWISVPSTETGNTGIRIDSDNEGTSFGVYGDIDASAGTGVGTHYGCFMDMDNFGVNTNNSSMYGFYTSVDGQGSGSKYGLYSTLFGDAASSGSRYGVYSNVNTTGTGSHYSGYFLGAPVYVADAIGLGTTAGLNKLDIETDGKPIGVNIDMNNSTVGTTYGIQIDNDYTGTSTAYGLAHFSSTTSTGTRYGVVNSMTGDGTTSASSHYGVYNFISSLATTGPRYGVYSSVTGGSTSSYAGYFVGKTYISSSSGGLVVGTTIPAAGYIVSVNGKVICEELKVQNSVDWPDYVFDEKYELMPLDELEKNIEENNHLPGIPKAEIVDAEGFHVGEMTTKMMEKIEELTLYTIQQQKEIDALKEQLENTTSK